MKSLWDTCAFARRNTKGKVMKQWENPSEQEKKHSKVRGSLGLQLIATSLHDEHRYNFPERIAKETRRKGYEMSYSGPSSVRRARRGFPR